MSGKRVATLLCLLMVVSSGCGSSASPAPRGAVRIGQAATVQRASIMLDWYPNSDHGGIYAAIRQGYFSHAGIAPEIEIPSSSTSQIALVGSGHADFGISYETDLLEARARGIPVRSVMCIVQHPLDTVMALRSSGITRPRDLVGKKIGMAGSPSDIPIVSAMMAHDGASVRRARMVNVGYNLLPVLLARKVEAVVGVYWTWEAIQARQKGFPVNVMRVEQWGVPNYCELVLVANTKTISGRPAFVRSVVQAVQRGYAYAESHPNAAWQALHAQDKTLNRSLVLQSLGLLKSAIVTGSGVGYQDPSQWAYYARWLYANKLISARVDAGAAFTNRFLAQVR